jgi:DNA-binding IclR family transcriptional regulator
MAGNSAEPGRSVTSKVVAILLTFTNGSTYSLTEIARLAGLSVSTAYRLAAELTESGFLERTDEGQYRVGPHLKVLSGQASGLPPNLPERARRVMEDLAAASGSSGVRLGVLRDLDVAFIEKPAGSRPASLSFEQVFLPAHATAMGKALLAFSPPRVVEMLIARGLKRYTPFTLTSPERLRRSLQVTRLTRVAVARRELDLTTMAVSVPVFGPGGHVMAALELQSRDGEDVRLMQPPLIMGARTLSRELAVAAPAGQGTAGGDVPPWPRAADLGHRHPVVTGSAGWRSLRRGLRAP